ncbi:MAG: hypothetical protein OEN56_01605 [Gemmatimonadota bacterium]|nr:hypothetical protein [Gemmatimonadota bacterium]
MILRVFLLSTAALLSCARTATAPELEPLGDADVTVLFVGNSLTAWNDLPGMVGSIADAAGRSYEYRSVLRPNYGLQDHWASGIEGVIRSLAPDVVVLQQGPSSVGDNPLNLRTWSERIGAVVLETGGTPALLMVWPEATRLGAFDAVRDSYAAAAAATNGLFIPAGDAWRQVWALDPTVSLYGPDGFHPSQTGSFVAALTVFSVLFDEDVRDLPPLGVGSADEGLLREAVFAAVSSR